MWTAGITGQWVFPSMRLSDLHPSNLDDWPWAGDPLMVDVGRSPGIILLHPDWVDSQNEGSNPVEPSSSGCWWAAWIPPVTMFPGPSGTGTLLLCLKDCSIDREGKTTLLLGLGLKPTKIGSPLLDWRGAQVGWKGDSMLVSSWMKLGKLYSLELSWDVSDQFSRMGSERKCPFLEVGLQLNF